MSTLSISEAGTVQFPMVNHAAAIGWTPVTPEAPGADPRTAASASAEPARPYTPWSTMVPRFWVPTVESDAD